MYESRNPFWIYSLQFYDDPKTQKACLDAQDRLNADVNLILYVLFMAQAGNLLEFESVKQANRHVMSWSSDVVQPLRKIRQNLKGLPYSLPKEVQKKIRLAIKELELKSERFEQEFLEVLELKSLDAAPKKAARDNLAAYLNILGADISDPVSAILLQRFDTLQTRNQSASASD